MFAFVELRRRTATAAAEAARSYFRPLSMLIAAFQQNVAQPRASIASFFALVFFLALVVWGAMAIPSSSFFPETEDTINSSDGLLLKLATTMLVYFMQLGFIAFEAGMVKQSYRRQSATKNLIVFGIAFLSYMSWGWRIQTSFNQSSISTLLDLAFNAGFASTVALIVANTITERGTLLINSLCSSVAAGIAYPFLAGLAFHGGPFASAWGFVDTAGGSVVHVVGGAFGLAAALWVGPRSKRRAWYLLGKVRVAEPNDNTPWTVIGAFFLWFGWLGFNSGNAESWRDFQVAFTNTNVAASAGGLVGLILAVLNRVLVKTAPLSYLSGGGAIREIVKLERVVLGMMGGLVAVTANAMYVEPWEALVEAVIGAAVAIVGSVVMQTYLRRLDDPLGAIATHSFAGTVGILCTAWFRPDLADIGTQALGCVMAVGTGCILASLLCVLPFGVERLERYNSQWWQYGKLLHLTPYEQQTGEFDTEVPANDIAEALDRVQVVPRVLTGTREVQGWITAVGVLALSGKPNSQVPELFTALDQLLNARFEGSPEEQKAIAAIAARVDVTRLPLCVERISAHRDPERPEFTDWKVLATKAPLYTETLVVTITELAESFRSDFRVLRKSVPAEEFDRMKEASNKARELLKEMAKETGETVPDTRPGLHPLLADIRS